MLVNYYKQSALAKKSKRVLDKRYTKDAYAIAKKYTKIFSKVFSNFTRNLLPLDMPKEFGVLWAKKADKEIISLVEDLTKDALDKFKVDILKVYTKIISESMTESKDYARRKFKLVKKLKGKAVPLVPISQYSIDWMKKKSLSLITAATSDQIKIVRGILSDSHRVGVRGQEVYSKIKANIGLNNQQYKALLNREVQQLESGMSKERSATLLGRYYNEMLEYRAEMIARTETIDAQAEGRLEGWKDLQESGDLPDNVVRTWMTPPPTSNPNNPCGRCGFMDGQSVALDEPYIDEDGEEVDGPPLHPQCGCAETIEQVGGET
jgi:hypothetical protein